MGEAGGDTRGIRGAGGGAVKSSKRSPEDAKRALSEDGGGHAGASVAKRPSIDLGSKHDVAELDHNSTLGGGGGGGGVAKRERTYRDCVQRGTEPCPSREEVAGSVAKSQRSSNASTESPATQAVAAESGGRRTGEQPCATAGSVAKRERTDRDGAQGASMAQPGAEEGGGSVAKRVYIQFGSVPKATRFKFDEGEV